MSLFSVEILRSNSMYNSYRNTNVGRATHFQLNFFILFYFI